MYHLNRISSYTGRAVQVSSSGSAVGIISDRCDDLDTWEVCKTYNGGRDQRCLVQFEGFAYREARNWLNDNPEYNGEAGCKAWEGYCDQCDTELCEGDIALCGCRR